MRHPNQATLALHAGGDLGKFARWKLERHLAKCDACAAEVASFEGVRLAVAELGEISEVPWNSLAAEMRANIRLGLEAGECVRTGATPLRIAGGFYGMRAAVACAAIAVLIATGIVLQRPRPQMALGQAPMFGQAPMVEATDNGIQLSAGGAAVGLMNRGIKVENVSYVTDAQGGVSATYVNSSGYITVNSVYGQ